MNARDSEKTQYLLLLRGGVACSSLSPREYEHLLERYMTWIDELRAAGAFVGYGALGDERRRVEGTERPVVTDGPFVEAREVVGGYFVVLASSLEEAVEVSKGCPVIANGGSVEVRPIVDRTQRPGG
jgi:hypothetical protein